MQLSNSAIVLANPEDRDLDTAIFVKAITIRGATIFSESEIEKVVAAYRGKQLSFSGLRNITKAITELYVSQGYITSGAFLPEQEIVNGEVSVRVVEGKLENVQINGFKNLQESYIRSFIAASSDREKVPLNIKRLENKLNLLKQDNSIKNVKAELVRGTQPDFSVLILDIEETTPWETSINFDNYRSPSVGEFQGTLTSAYGNLIGLSDRIFASYNFSQGFDAYAIGYELPLGHNKGIFDLEYRNGDSKIVENFEDVGIRAESNSFTVGYTQPIVRQPAKEISLGIAFEKKNSNTFILDNLPFSFVEGPQQGRSRTSVVKLQANWLERKQKSVLAFNSRLDFGLDLFDATVNDDAPDGIFFSWFNQVQWTTALNRSRNLLLVTRLVTQLTPNSLLPLEQFTLGGIGTVRGYRQNQEIGDNAVVGTLEIYLPLFSDRYNYNILNLIPFFDGGRVWNNNGGNYETLASLGLGLDWQFKDWLSFRVDWGIPLINTQNFGDSLQDDGFTFSIQLQPF